tara:strand:- start:767 stop:970 length:204 start_codon:yes stop_codon:yes gene_type:complete
MSNFSDFPKIGENRPIMRVEEDLRRIKTTLNTLIIDTQIIKSDIAEIKEILKKKEESQNISGGWWIY